MELIITCQTSPATLYYVLKYSQHNSSMQNHNNFFQLIMYFLLVKRTIEHMINSIKTEGNINMVLLNVWQHSLGLTTISLFGVRSKLSKSTKNRTPDQTPTPLFSLALRGLLLCDQATIDNKFVFFFSYYVSIIFLLCPQRL